MKVGIIGGGPAGLSAAIALGCEGIDAVCIAPKFGGRMGISPLVENIPGFVGGIDGEDYNQKLVRQAEFFGVQRRTAEALAIWGGANPEVVQAGFAGYVRAERFDAVIIASGITMDAPAEPTPVEDKQLQVVVGGGDAAVQVAIQHANAGTKTVLAVRGNDLSKCSAYLRQRVFKVPNLTVRYNTEATIVGAGTVRVGDETISNASLQRLVGGTPKAANLFGVEQDERGFILTDGMFHTSRPNVFAVGDVRSGSIKRVAVAAGEGIAVGHIVANYLRR